MVRRAMNRPRAGCPDVEAREAEAAQALVVYSTWKAAPGPGEEHMAFGQPRRPGFQLESTEYVGRV